jgi:hypothetical protein
MAEQQLNRPHVSAGLEQMYGERVSQGMWRNRLANVAAPLRLLTDLLHGASRQGARGDPARKEPALRSRHVPPRAQQLQQLGREHYVPILLALALLDANDHPTAVDVSGFQVERFGDAQTRRVTGRQNRAMLEARSGQNQEKGLGSRRSPLPRSFTLLCQSCADCRRRLATRAKPSNPVPRSTRLAGSGLCTVVSTLNDPFVPPFSVMLVFDNRE